MDSKLFFRPCVNYLEFAQVECYNVPASEISKLVIWLSVSERANVTLFPNPSSTSLGWDRIVLPLWVFGHF